MLVLGTDLRLFIRQHRIGNKRKCKHSELYCFKCREPREPALNTAKFIQLKNGNGRVFAECNQCGSKINKYFSWRQLDLICEHFQVESTVSTKTHS